MVYRFWSQGCAHCHTNVGLTKGSGEYGRLFKVSTKQIYSSNNRPWLLLLVAIHPHHILCCRRIFRKFYPLRGIPSSQAPNCQMG